ncbi:hypothetical protein DPMN_187038 [Dreissena polymorpha]|uniref:Uncharacterized protein n=1 Tax=Dreissena polymorpha TaxID=45954 RepID=A0A9D4DNA7_DREPO|nr:hypothetical protein DPMN_187038 [Dreissena polymorpha]
MEDGSDYDEFFVVPYIYEPEFTDSQSDLSDSDSDSGDNFADDQEDHVFGNTDWLIYNCVSCKCREKKSSIVILQYKLVEYN